MRIPITTYPDHVRLSRKDVSYFFSTMPEIEKNFIQNNTQQLKGELLLLGNNNQQTPLKIFSSNNKYSKIIIAQATAQSLQLTESTACKITDGNKTLPLPDNINIGQTHLTMSQADAEHRGLKQGIKVNFNIPYKNVLLEKIKVRVKDYFLPDLFIMQDDAKRLGIEHNDRGTIIDT